mmetsp:Transcript_41592/g.110916  ORF Transcript_41592/g.110916 Transcript_41592/m.110916 type:complete len:211 (-) Transcript_41592:218-850(-)
MKSMPPVRESPPASTPRTQSKPRAWSSGTSASLFARVTSSTLPDLEGTMHSMGLTNPSPPPPPLPASPSTSAPAAPSRRQTNGPAGRLCSVSVVPYVFVPASSVLSCWGTPYIWADTLGWPSISRGETQFPKWISAPSASTPVSHIISASAHATTTSQPPPIPSTRTLRQPSGASDRSSHLLSSRISPLVAIPASPPASSAVLTTAAIVA